MKKKLSLILCSAMLLLSVSGCGEESGASSQQSQQTTSNSQISSQVDASNVENDAEESYTVTEVSDFSDGYAWIYAYNTQTGNKNNSQKVCINSSGEIQFFLDEKIQGESFEVTDFKDGYCIVSNENDEEFIINTKGEIMLSSKDEMFDRVLSFGGGYFVVEKYINDYHTAEYKAFIINEKGEQIGDYWMSQQNEFDENIIEYNGDGVFSCLVGGSNWTDRYSYDLINVERGNTFSVEKDYRGIDFVDGLFLLVEDSKPILLSSDGNTQDLKINIEEGASVSYGAISDGGFVYCVNKDENKNVYFYDIESGKSTEIYNCGKGINVGFGKFSDGYLVLMLKGDEKSYFTVVDKSGNTQFEPIEYLEVYNISYDRIISHKDDGYKVFTVKGEEIKIPDDYIIHQNYYVDNLVAVHKETDGNWNNYNYIDLDGNLLFEDNKIYYPSQNISEN